MIHYKRDFLDFFPDRTIFEIFCDVINNSRANVFVLMAHKAIQMVQVLRDQGYLDNRIDQKIIISSQALDFDCSYLVGKTVAIIDDIVISGTSIASAVHKLIQIGVSEENIDIIALARDKDYQTMSFESTSGRNTLLCYSVLRDSDCIKLSYLISEAFSFYGTPYNIDHPVYSTVDLRDNKIQLLTNHLLWRTECTTNDDQQVGDVTSYILFPNQGILNMLWKKLDADLSDCVHMKIRAYVRRYPSGRLECSIVPMCLFNEISESDLQKIYVKYSPNSPQISLSSSKLHIAQMRYLEFYIAHQMYLVFNDVTSLDLPLMPTKESLHLLFGYNDGDIIRAFLSEDPRRNESTVLIKSQEYIDHKLLEDFLTHPIGQEMIKNIANTSQLDVENQNSGINQIILAPFTWWYDTKEITARKEMMSPVKHYIRDYDTIEKVLERLRSGFSLRTIQYLLSGTHANKDCEIFVSLFMDHAIDRGIIVPTIYHNSKKQYLCRAYRHGEDLPFSLEDECRLAYFLEKLCKLIPDIDVSPSTKPLDGGLSEIAFEKMIVLFYQMGIRNGKIFNRFLGFNNMRILKPFLSLHGAIQAFVDPQKMKKWGISKTHLYSEKDASGNRYITWLTHWSKANGFAWNSLDKDGTATTDVFLNKNKISQYLAKNQRNCIDSSISSAISDIAGIIAAWYNGMIENGEKSAFKDDATALTSCSNAHLFVSAIATELHYYSKFWFNQVKKAFDGADDYDEMQFILSKEDDRKNTANTIQGLNSGRKKVQWYRNGSAKKVVQKVIDYLKDSNSNNWVSFWTHVRETPEYTSPQLDSYIKQAVSFLYFYSACNDCLMHKPFWQIGETPPYYNDFRREYDQESSSVYFDLTQNWFESLDKISSIVDFSEKKHHFFNLVNQALQKSKNLVDNIEDEVENHAPDYTISYVSSLIFEVNALNPDSVEQKIMELWNQQTDLTSKIHLNIIPFPQPQEDCCYRRYGLFFGIISNQGSSMMHYADNGKFLLSLFEQLCQAFNGRAKGIRGILLPHTPSGLNFRHSTQKRVADHANRFAAKIVHDLETMYIRDSTHQLVLAMTDSMEQGFLDYVRNKNWYDSYRQNVSTTGNYAQIVTFYNSPLPIAEQNNFAKVFYSTVILNCGPASGMGFLVNTGNRIVCVTCNHILESYTKNKSVIKATTDNLSFDLKPIKPICTLQDPQKLLSAEEDVAVLEPVWHMRIPYNHDCLISIDALDCTLSDNTGKECQCCGCINKSNRLWHDNLKLVAPSDVGYYQINDPDKALKEGCSGGIAILNPMNPIILGMHKGRIQDTDKPSNGTYPLLIPSTIIKVQIKKWEVDF